MTMTVCLRSKENVMSSKPLLISIIALGLAGCHETPLVVVNTEPLADARVVNMDGKSVDEKTVAEFTKKNPDAGMEAQAMTRFDFDGKDVEVTLDGTHSSDEDGHIVKYEWFSGNLDADAGVRSGPKPDDVAKPKVKVGEGTWRFVLFVTDNKGKRSQPDTVAFTVGAPPATSDPKVAACVANVIPSVPTPCATCVCALDDTCRMNVQKDVCDADCWGLIQCIGQKCPTFSMDMDTSCVITNCMDVLGGSTGAMAAGSCVVKCLDSCPAMSADADAGM
jgi:hypothetical protein